MTIRPELSAALDVQVTTHGDFPGVDEYVRDRIGRVGRFAHRPILFARVVLTRAADPAVARPVVARANLDVEGRPVRAQVAATTAREAVDLLEARLRHRLERVAEHREARRGDGSSRLPAAAPPGWRLTSGPAGRPHGILLPESERQVVRHAAFTTQSCTVDEAAFDMDQLDHDFSLFTELGTGQDSVLYRAGPAGYRLAQLSPSDAGEIAVSRVPLTYSPAPAPRLGVEEALVRLELLDLPFLFFADDTSGRGRVLHHRYDGHYGLVIPPA